jgi:hypothetical protein
VTARITGAPDTATADVVTDVRQTRWAVLFYDPQPSWMSTFVRRAVEQDPRFVVTSRVVTSKNISTDAGTPPNRLDDLSSTSRFDAIVVGSPGALSEAEIGGLDAYARKRGGNVVLLCDGDFTPKAWRLTQVRSWTSPQRQRLALPIISRTPGATSTDTVLFATELSWPSEMPGTAEVLARTVSSIDSLTNRPMLWRVPLGAGRVTVSSALDSWRYRGQTGFDKLWPTVLADASSASIPAVDVRVSPGAVAPRENIDVDVTIRDAALREVGPRDTVHVGIAAEIVGPRSSRTRIPVWPTANTGEFHTTVRAPNDTGAYRIVVTSGGLSADAPLVVANGASRPMPNDIDLLESLVAARGGKVISAAALDGLAPAIAAIVRPASRAETWHPMRSIWWIVPFALALGAEWLLRRRAGLS